MTRVWRLTPLAEWSLVDIARWTIRTFGETQAEAYEATLIAACEAIAAGTAQVRDCSAFVPDEAEETLLFARAGHHFVVFAEMEDEIVILDFIHGRADLPRHLVSLRGRGA